MKIKTSEATNIQLNWLVAKCEEVLFPRSVPKYSTDWAQGGPIIEREQISLDYRMADRVQPWTAYTDDHGTLGDGPAPLIAAMRAYVTSKLGDEVEVPDALA